ncbi:chemotaxis protein CheA [Desulfovibrio inopinatus]|uniref:chemotaxis protein CheA n=1 Tax=Desulfovibrio inopinatus TaxID=102109 RepID=UPI000400BE5E|nr:chemotaxis protein CheA [Desulfovibrio inopinatus]
MKDFELVDEVFIAEAHEHLADLEDALLELENDPLNKDLVARAFRAMHTLKGSGAMFGYTELSRFAHDAETAFDLVRKGRLDVDSHLLTLFLTVKDHILQLLTTKHPSQEIVLESDHLLAQIKSLMSDVIDEKASPGQRRLDAVSGETLYWVRYMPSTESYLMGPDPAVLAEQLGRMGSLREEFHGERYPSLDLFDPEKTYGHWDFLLLTLETEEQVQKIFSFTGTEEEAVIRALGQNLRVDADDIMVLLDEMGKIAPDMAMGRLQEYLTEPSVQSRPDVAKPHSGSVSTLDAGKSLRVDSDRLDSLVNMVGELVILQSRIAQLCRRREEECEDGDIELASVSEDLERLSDKMRNSALRLRMVPIGTTFGGFRRLVRDLCAQFDKSVELVLEGAETELDKVVIDRLKDPLMHILRNSLDHGIESASNRLNMGKPETGTVRLEACHGGGEVIIRIRDDGRGINPNLVLRKAKARNLVAADAELDDKDILNLIFEPGFSTKDEVTDISGRGVGMDVVKRSIEGLRGRVEIVSQPGQGTTFTIRLPLTLAIIDGLCVVIGNEHYIVPLAHVESCQERFFPTPEARSAVKTIESFDFIGAMTPCLSLRKILGVPSEQSEYERIIIVSVDGIRVGLAVDVIIGRQQAVIKSLSDLYKNINLISGTTINGDGGISLILDVPALIKQVATQK